MKCSIASTFSLGWHRTTCVLLVTVLTALLPAFAPAKTRSDAENDRPVVTVKLLDGSQKTLKGPVTIQGDQCTEDYAITRLTIDVLQRIERAEDQAANRLASERSRPNSSADLSPTIWTLSFRNELKPISVQCSKEASITGDGEWGKETIRFENILWVELVHTAEPVPFKSSNSWRCTFSSSATLLIEISPWEIRRFLTGRVLDAQVALDPDKVREVVRDDEGFRISCLEGLDIGPLASDCNQISARSPVGQIRIMLPQMIGLEPSTPKTVSPDTTTSSETRLPVTVQSVGGMTMAGWISELRVGDFALTLSPDNFVSGPVSQSNGSWTFAMRGNKELSFRPADDAELSGFFPAGTFKFPATAIGHIAIRDIPSGGTYRDSSAAATRGWIEDRHGNRLELLGECRLSGGTIFDLHYPRSPFRAGAGGLLVLPGRHVRYAVDGTALFDYTVKYHDNALELVDCNGSTVSSTLGHGCEFQGNTYAGKLNVSRPNFSRFEWRGSFGDGPSFRQPAHCAATIKVRDGDTIPVGTLAISCRNTLKPGWYADGRLYRFTVSTIPVKHDGGVTSIEFRKLREIRPSQDYRKDRQVNFVSRSGSTLVGSLDLEAIKKSTHQTYLSDEGIAAELGPGIFVFVNFADIDSVKLTEED
jgi:hypothetical protein